MVWLRQPAFPVFPFGLRELGAPHPRWNIIEFNGKDLLVWADAGGLYDALGWPRALHCSPHGGFRMRTSARNENRRTFG